jgi:RNA polymerase sigma-70 factor (ECF subfamily)
MEAQGGRAGRRPFPAGRGSSAGGLLGSRTLSSEDFERLYEENAEPLLSFLTLRTGDRALAEDLLADTFERALRKRGIFDRRRGSGKNWLYSIALNLLRDHLRRTRVEGSATERLRFERGTEAFSRELERVEDRDAVGRALGTLSAEEREAVALRFGADLSMPEIAQLIGVPLTTVEGRIYRALGKLRPEIGRADS